MVDQSIQSVYLLFNIDGNKELYGRIFTPNVGQTVSPTLSATETEFHGAECFVLCQAQYLLTVVPTTDQIFPTYAEETAYLKALSGNQ